MSLRFVGSGGRVWRVPNGLILRSVVKLIDVVHIIRRGRTHRAKPELRSGGASVRIIIPSHIPEVLPNSSYNCTHSPVTMSQQWPPPQSQSQSSY